MADKIDNFIMAVAVEGADKAQAQLEAIDDYNRRFKDSVKDLNRQLSETGKQQETVAKKTQKTTEAVKGATTQAQLLSRALKWVAGYLATGKLLQTADAWSAINSKIKLATSSEEEFNRIQERLYQIAQKSHQDMGATADLYAQIASNAKSLNLDEQKRLKLTETINKALAVGGADAMSNQRALTQFSQALSLGKFQGQDLRSIVQNTRGFADVIAKGMGLESGGQLMELGANGDLTADKVVNALLSQADEVDKKFGKVKVTFEAGLTNVKNSFVKFVGTLNDSLGITDKLVTALDFLSTAFDKLGKCIGVVSSLIGGVLIKRLIDMRRVFLESRAPIGTMRNALQMVVSGEVLNGLRALAVSGWAAVAPFLKFAAIAYAIKVVINLLIELWKWLKGDEDNLFTHLGEWFEAHGEEIKAWFAMVGQWLKDFAEGFADVLAWPFEKFWEYILKLGEKIGEWVANIVVMIKDGISNAWQSAKNSVKGWFGFGDDEVEVTKNINATPMSMPQVPQAPIPLAGNTTSQSYTDNKQVTFVINEAKNPQATMTMINRDWDEMKQTPFRGARLGYAGR